ncbi:MAG TPA: LacI family DNA-binding transcriptional regulator [Lacunisphaera sp.]|nr:LacI family DNA-binding transcriptional regulator [Lacunisphaera sp.]
MSPTAPEREAPPARRPTLKDVARETGYHITTISLALRSHPSIPDETRTRIQEVARRIGYQRNPVFHALSRFRQQGCVRAPAPRIAYLENYGAGAGISRQPHLQAMYDGARRQAELLGYQLDVLGVGEDDHDARSLSHYLRHNNITGIVLGAFQPGFADIALNWDEYAVAKIHSRHTEPNVTVIANDQLREVRMALRRLAALGYRRIGLAVGRADEDSSGHRHTAGYLMELAAVSPDFQVPPLIFPYNTDGAMLGGMIARWVKRHHVDAVICNWISVREIIQQAGLRVPEDVACACLCVCDPAPENLAGVRPHLHLVGERAVSIVVTQLKSGQLGPPEVPSSIHVESTWHDGSSAPSRH